jgi:hypothetical protein
MGLIANSSRPYQRKKRVSLRLPLFLKFLFLTALPDNACSQSLFFKGHHLIGRPQYSMLNIKNPKSYAGQKHISRG